MGRLCCVYGCRGNYRGEPYSQVVSFPKDEKSRNEWFEALPNDRKQLEEKKQLWVCRKHFNCDFIKSQGGERPTGPPTIFEGIPKSCLKQVTTKQRQTTCTLAEKRNKLDDDKKKREDKILSFEAFRKELPKKVDNEFVFKISNESEITIYKTDDLGKTVMFFFHFKKVDSPIGFLKVVSVEKEGIEIQKKILGIPKNSLIHRWSQLTDIVNKTFTFEASNDKV